MKKAYFLIILMLSNTAFALQKNVASQKWVVFAFDRTDNTAKAGDAAQITADVYIDGVINAVDDTNPTELAHGYYVFDITAAESNGDSMSIDPVSSTADIQVVGCPMAVWTTPPYFPALSIDASGRVDVIKIAGTAQTANDNGADINAILEDTGTTLDTLIKDVPTVAEFEARSLVAADYTVVGDLGTVQTGDSYAIVNGDHGLVSIQDDIDAILTDTSAYDTDAEYAAAIWNALTNAYGGAGTYGQAAEDILTDTTEIGAAGVGLTEAGGDGDHLTAINLPNQTMDIVGDITGNLSGSVGSLTGHTVQTGDSFAIVNGAAGLVAINADVEAILADTGTDGVVVASIKTNAVSADALNADAVTEIWAKAMSDLAAGAPSATASVLTAINWLYEAWRNQTWATATEITIYKDDASTPLVESTISDDATTFKRGEMRTPD